MNDYYRVVSLMQRLKAAKRYGYDVTSCEKRLSAAREIVKTHFSALDETERTAAQFFLIEGKTYAETADAMNYSIRHVGRLLRSVKKKVGDNHGTKEKPD